MAQVCARSHKGSIQSELLLEVFRSNPSAQRGATYRSQLGSDKPVLVEYRQTGARKQDLKKRTFSQLVTHSLTVPTREVSSERPRYKCCWGLLCYRLAQSTRWPITAYPPLSSPSASLAAATHVFTPVMGVSCVIIARCLTDAKEESETATRYKLSSNGFCTYRWSLNPAMMYFHYVS